MEDRCTHPGRRSSLGLNFVFAGGETVELGNLKSAAPANWKAQKPSNKFRAYQFSVPKVDGDKEDAELVIFFFGKGSGGSNDDNIKRWKGFFIAPEGKSIDDVTKIGSFKLGKAAECAYVEISGTYKDKFPPFDPKAKEIRKENYRLLGVILDCEGGPFFIKLTGPAKTVEKNKSAFEGWIKSFK